MANINKYKSITSTKAKLDDGLVTDEPRPYLGMSGLADSCHRKLYLEWRWCTIPSHTRRLKRLFARGHREEEHILNDLSRIGIICSSVQSTMVDTTGHIKGHNDGSAINVPEAPKTRHLLEFKTMSKSSFAKVSKDGVKIANPVYYGQCQLYMHYLKLTRTLWIAVCKDNDEYYVTRLKYDKQYALDLISKGQSIVFSEDVPPVKAPHGPTYFKCKHMCSAYDVCFRGAKFKKSCRSCKFGAPAAKGTWYCSHYSKPIPEDFQRKGCKYYRSI